MAAVIVVLCTYELLEQIIAELPPKDITVVKRVNKTWRSIILESPRIRKIHVIDPLTGSDFSCHMVRDHSQAANGDKVRKIEGKIIMKDHLLQKPHYDGGSDLQFNTCLRPIRIFKENSRALYANSSKHDHYNLSLILFKRPRFRYPSFAIPLLRQFVTHPPVSVIALETREAWQGYDKGDQVVCMIRNPSGITVGDVLTVQDAMIRSDANYNPHHRADQREMWYNASVITGVDVDKDCLFR